HLGTDVIDSYVLHGPMQRSGLTAVDWEAWRAMEAIHDRGRIRLLGISNVGLDQLQLLWQNARVRPVFVQNRCYASDSWDLDVRKFCTANAIVYQGFSLLTANRQVTTHREVIRIAQKLGRTTNQVVFRFALEIGMLPLSGTTRAEHMREDLEVFDFTLTPE